MALVSDPMALEMAVGVLPVADAAVWLRVGEGREVEGRVADHGSYGIEVAVPSGWVRVGDPCTVVVRDDRRAGFEIKGLVTSFKQGEQQHETLRLAVLAVRRVKNRRTVPRVAMSESAVLDWEADAIDVLVVDVASNGFAFTTTHALEVGERLSVVLNIDHKVIPVTGEVANVTTIEDDLLRVGCRFVEIADVYRHLLDRLTRQSTHTDRRSDQTPTQTELGAPSALIRRLREHAQADSRSTAARETPDRQITMLYCRACARFTLHIRPTANHDYSCAGCDTSHCETTKAA